MTTSEVLSSVTLFVNFQGIAMCKIWLFVWPQKQQQLHYHMEKREVDWEELVAMHLCALAVPLYLQ
jgi:hypothetical protein